MDLLRIGEAHRVAANTKLNTKSSRSHAILMVNVRRAVKGRSEMNVSMSAENGHSSSMMDSLRPLIVRKSKLVVVDLEGSERIDKSGSEGHTLEEAKSINLSLSSLGKCIVYFLCHGYARNAMNSFIKYVIVVILFSTMAFGSII